MANQPHLSRSETILPRILIFGVVIAVGLYLFSQTKDVRILDTRLFYTPEEALLYFRALDPFLRSKVVHISVVDAVIFVPAYGVLLWWLTKSFSLGKLGKRLFLLTVFADTLENALILTAVTLISPPGWTLLTLLSIATPLKWGSLAAWILWFLVRVIKSSL